MKNFYRVKYVDRNNYDRNTLIYNDSLEGALEHMAKVDSNTIQNNCFVGYSKSGIYIYYLDENKNEVVLERITNIYPEVLNSHSLEINFTAASSLMDDEIKSKLDDEGIMHYQTYFDEYCNRHFRKYGEEFELNKENPVW